MNAASSSSSMPAPLPSGLETALDHAAAADGVETSVKPAKQKVSHEPRCYECYQVHARCVPKEFVWPERCDRCKEKGYPCTNPRTAVKAAIGPAEEPADEPADNPTFVTQDLKPFMLQQYSMIDGITESFGTLSGQIDVLNDRMKFMPSVAQMFNQIDHKLGHMDQKLSSIAQHMEAKIDSVAYNMEAKMDVVAYNIVANMKADINALLDAKLAALAQTIASPAQQEDQLMQDARNTY